MTRLIFAAVLALASGGLALGQATSFGQARRGADRAEIPAASLADIMVLVQVRHIKLWFAGRAANWDLMAYEVRQIGDNLERAALLYANIPLELVAAAGAPVRALEAAARDRSAAAFASGYAALRDACNGCHAAAGVAFIRIQTPTAFPFSDQALAPEPAERRVQRTDARSAPPWAAQSGPRP